MSCYSLDLRKKVLNFHKKGNSIRKTANVFGVHFTTIANWKKREAKEGLKPKNNTIRKAKKITQIELEKFIQEHPEKTLEQIAKSFKVCINSIFYRVRKGNITYKKKNSYTKKETKKIEKNISKKS